MTATGADDTHAETAIDASTSWTRFPRTGYLSHFKPAAPDGLADNATYEPYLFHAPSDYVTKLSQDYHLNAFQYYDWQYRHEHPVATGDLKNEWPLWYRDTYASAATINTYVTKADAVGATEQVFGHLKDEFFRGQDWQTFESFKADLDAYITHWNTTRRQVKLKGLTPAEYRDQALREPHNGYP